MGIVGAAIGLNASIQQQLAERIAAQQYADKMRQQDIDNQMREKQFQSNEELKRAQLDATTASRQDAEHDRQVGLASSLADQIPGGQFMTPDDPAVGMLRTGGRGSLLQAQDERPAVDTGPLLPGDTGAAKAQGFIKTRSAKQINTDTDNERQAAQQETAAQHQADELTRQQARDNETNRHNRAIENKPPHEPSPQPQMMVGPDGKMHAMQFVNGVAREIPLPDGFVKAGGAADKEMGDTRKSKAAIAQLNQSLDTVKDLVGPAAGRGETVEQWLGTADPRIQAFGTKLLLAKMLIDKSVTGSARAGASAPLLARWDNLLGNKVSYEGMKSALQAADEIIGGSPAGTGQVQTGKPTAADLIKKYGGQ